MHRYIDTEWHMHFICNVWGLDHWCLHFFVFPRWYPLCLTPFWLRRPSECWMIKWPSLIWEFSWWALWVSRFSPVPATTEPSTSQPLLRTCCTHPNRWEPWEVTTRLLVNIIVTLKSEHSWIINIFKIETLGCTILSWIRTSFKLSRHFLDSCSTWRVLTVQRSVLCSTICTPRKTCYKVQHEDKVVHFSCQIIIQAVDQWMMFCLSWCVHERV